MPHISVKMYPGRSAEMKQQFAEKLAAFTIQELECDPKHVSISFKEIDADKWKDAIGPELANEEIVIEADF